MFFESFLLNLTILAALIVALIFDYATKFFSYWYIRNVPYKTPVPFFGTDYHRVLGLRSTTEEVNVLYNRYPNDLVGTIKSRIPDLLVKQPDAVRKILSTDFANFHSRGLALDRSRDVCLRNNPFYAEGEKWMLLREALDSLLNGPMGGFEVSLHGRLTRDDGVVNIQQLLTEILDAVFGDCLFAGKEDALLLRDLRKSLQRRTVLEKFKSYLKEIFPSMFVSLGLVTTPGQPATETLELIKESVLATRIREIGLEERLNGKCRKGDSKSVTEAEIAFSVLSLFISEGYLPCLNVITSLLYELARNPQIQSKLREKNLCTEIDYLDVCIKETLRLYSPYSVVNRECVKAYHMSDSSILIDKKVTITVPIDAIHRDSVHYENPHTFDPDRFLHRRNEAARTLTYLPFGAGPRKCIGERFALKIVSKVTKAIITNYKIETTDKTPASLNLADQDFKRTITDDVWLKFTTLDLQSTKMI